MVEVEEKPGDHHQGTMNVCTTSYGNPFCSWCHSWNSEIKVKNWKVLVWDGKLTWVDGEAILIKVTRTCSGPMQADAWKCLCPTWTFNMITTDNPEQVSRSFSWSVARFCTLQRQCGCMAPMQPHCLHYRQSRLYEIPSVNVIIYPLKSTMCHY